MKNLFLTGATALVLGGYLAGCTHDDYDYTSIVESKKQAYQEVFVDAYGSIDPNQTWGFTNLDVTRAENANGNEWADIKNSTGFGGWLVPDTLTVGQKLRVMAYFQANPYLTYQDPHWRNFFVQQVYKGGTNVTANNKSTETVVAADGSTYNSNNMNLMTVGQSAVHINNFNYGDCSVYGNVLDNGSDILAGITSYHPDKIMLMVDIDDTSCFGYHETGSSNEENTPTGQHNDRAALVAASVIDAWATAHRDSLTAIGRFGENVVDKWNRSFLGYDLAIKEGDQIYSGETQKLTSGMNMGYDGLYYSDSNIVYFNIDDNYNRSMPNGMSDDMLGKDGQPLKILESNMNFYSGQAVTLDGSELRKDIDGKVLVNMVKVNQLINDGYLPVSGAALQTWVKPAHSYDNYYSDWIVTLTEAKRIAGLDETTIPVDQSETGEGRITIVTTREFAERKELIEQGRVFCEDLGQISSNDLDFNDVVFDAYVYKITPITHLVVTEDGVEVTNTTTEGEPTYKTEIVLLAAGGTLQLSLAGVEVHNKLGGNPTSTIINTAGTGDNAYGNVSATSDPMVLGTDFNYSSIVSIPIRVLYGNGETLELTAAQGWAPHKILVPVGTKWCKERVNIADAYTNFRSYVGTSSKFWEGTIDDSKLYKHPKDNYSPRSTEAETTRTGTEGPTTTYRNTGTQSTTGGYQGEEVLSREGQNLFNE